MDFGRSVRRPAGFTMIELVVTMIIIGIMAVVALPRMMSRSDFDPTAFRDTTLALLRYAQKSAIAQRRNVCVTFTASSASLTMAASPGDGTACTIALAGPDGRSPASVTAPSTSTGFTATPAAITFRARGDTNQLINRTLSIKGGSAITVERVTGYVH